jgi:hypothetical protein
MRSAGNFHPEWGYLAPAPSFLRTLRIAVVATAVGATAGAGVVVSLVGRPTAPDFGDTSIAARALVTSVQAATPQTASPSLVNKPALAQPHVLLQAQVPVPLQVQAPVPAVESKMSPPPTGGRARSAGASEAGTTSQALASVVAPAKVAPATATAPPSARQEAAVAPAAAPAQKKAAKKRRSARYEAIRRWQRNGGDVRKKWTRADRGPDRGLHGGLGPLLLRLFTARTGSSFSAN